MQSRTKLVVGIVTVTTIALALARRRRAPSTIETDQDEPTVAEEELEAARP
jgi:hypothetical protein